MKKLLVFICLALCMILFVCSCGGNNDTDTSANTNTDTQTSTDTDTNTDTGSQTPDDSDIIIGEEKYRVFVCDSDGNGIAGVYVQFCTASICDFKPTDSQGYLEIPSGDYHIASVTDETGNYWDIVYEEADYLHFEGDSKLITIVLTAKAK